MWCYPVQEHGPTYPTTSQPDALHSQSPGTAVIQVSCVAVLCTDVTLVARRRPSISEGIRGWCSPVSIDSWQPEDSSCLGRHFDHGLALERRKST